jgi:hypothetical protein
MASQRQFTLRRLLTIVTAIAICLALYGDLQRRLARQVGMDSTANPNQEELRVSEADRLYVLGETSALSGAAFIFAVLGLGKLAEWVHGSHRRPSPPAGDIAP